MITRIILENFMAHELTELELGPGINALTGPNNTGKSAIVEGLRCVATNPVPRHYIRHGAKEARVTVEIEDGTRVVWIRKKRSSGYELWAPGAEEPEEYWRFGRKPPEDVLAALRLDLVELETGAEVDVHVGNQRDPVFLLNQPGSNAAAFFAASTESAHLLAMQNLLKRRTLDAKRTEKDLEERLGRIAGELDLFSPLPGIELRVETVRELEATAKELQKTIPELEQTLEASKNVSELLVAADQTTNVLKPLSSPPDLNDTKHLDATIGQLKYLEDALSTTREHSQKLAELRSMPTTHDTGSLARLTDLMDQNEQALKKAVEKSSVFSELSEPPQPESTQPLSVLLDQIVEVSHRTRRLAGWGDVLQHVAEPPVVEPLLPLENLLAELRQLEQEQGTAAGRKDALENELETLKSAIRERVEAIGSCPTCGSDLNSATFLDPEGHHDV